ncbi:hypothetical protein ILUMI_20400 [Ignelater luminosus]|uniref:non-specific serine/threonine protein kinase n=1 Tax=Ignelater luminosus TaxID=2038154 RepID=A0A8K0FYY7_IGNLU|nr:hypothetical protein ILUMI_20400 [Ignelater luminosus]
MYQIPCVARNYGLVLQDKPEDYFNYNNEVVNVQDGRNYALTKKLGSGQYSDVYKTIDVRNQRTMVCKVLKRYSETAFKREIKILRELHNGVNVINFFEAVYFPNTSNQQNRFLITKEACSLLASLLRYDPQERATARETLYHKYFAY